MSKIAFVLIALFVGVNCSPKHRPAASHPTQLTDQLFPCAIDSSRVQMVKGKLAAYPKFIQPGHWTEKEINLVYEGLSRLPDTYFDFLLATHKANGLYITPEVLGGGVIGMTRLDGSTDWYQTSAQVISIDSSKHVFPDADAIRFALVHETFHALEPFIIGSYIKKMGGDPETVTREYQRERAAVVSELQRNPRVRGYALNGTETTPELADSYFCSPTAKKFIQDMAGTGNPSKSLAFAEKYFLPPTYEGGGGYLAGTTKKIFMALYSEDAAKPASRALISASGYSDKVFLCKGDSYTCFNKPTSIVPFVAQGQVVNEQKIYVSSADVTFTKGESWTLLSQNASNNTLEVKSITIK